MSYRSLLVQFSDQTRDRGVIATGLELAYHFGAHLTALHLHVPTDAARAAFAEFPVWGSVKALQQEQARAAERDAALKQVFQTRAARAGVGATEWRFQSGELDEAVALNARYADLVIMPQHDPAKPVDHSGFDTPAAVAILSARPVLVMPPGAQIRATGNRILLAWDTSREAARAATAALPLMRHAESVDIVMVMGQGHDYGEEPGADIALFLARHGVNASVSRVAQGDLRVSETLLSVASERGADLLCMGAYGHSRLRELVFGGVTFDMMRHTTLPLLIAG